MKMQSRDEPLKQHARASSCRFSESSSAWFNAFVASAVYNGVVSLVRPSSSRDMRSYSNKNYHFGLWEFSDDRRSSAQSGLQLQISEDSLALPISNVAPIVHEEKAGWRGVVVLCGVSDSVPDLRHCVTLIDMLWYSRTRLCTATGTSELRRERAKDGLRQESSILLLRLTERLERLDCAMNAVSPNLETAPQILSVPI